MLFSCSYSYLKITNEDKVPIAEYCEAFTLMEVSVGGDYMVITFQSGHSDNRRGIQLRFTPVQPSKCNLNATRCMLDTSYS